MADLATDAGSAGVDARGAPGWFTTALRRPGEPLEVDVAGTPIAALTWGRPGDPTVVLVHGEAAHARWWAPHAPLLARGLRVVSLDLSGHGDSGRRERYSAHMWAREVVEVADAVGDSGPTVVVGHSMGGLVTTLAAAEFGERLAGAIVLDVSICAPERDEPDEREQRMFRAPKTYPDLATAMAHFHLVPPQPCENPWIVAHTARHSLREVPGGWTWKFDPRIFSSREGPSRPSDFGPFLARAACRMAVMNGEDSSIVDDHVRDHMAGLLSRAPGVPARAPMLDVPAAHHHLLLDQPVAVVAAIRTVLAGWEASDAPGGAHGRA